MQRGLAGKFGGDDAEALLEFGEIPALAAKDADLGFRLDDRVALAGDGLDESGFAAAVGAENGDVLAGVDAEIDVVKDEVVAAGYVYVSQFEKRWHLISRIDGFRRMEESMATVLDSSDQRLAYALLRMVVGLNLLMHGVSRMLAGPGTFAAKLAGQFAHAPLPAWSVWSFRHGAARD